MSAKTILFSRDVLKHMFTLTISLISLVGSIVLSGTSEPVPVQTATVMINDRNIRRANGMT